MEAHPIEGIVAPLVNPPNGKIIRRKTSGIDFWGRCNIAGE
jgi:hypothetical protein